MFNFLFKNKPQESYSQCGEDLIIQFILNCLNEKDITYLDIGTNHPFKLNNTALFYKRGFHGVCVEADPFQIKEIKKYRPRDICLNIGVGPKELKNLDFYIMSTPTLNTFSEEEARRYVSYGKQKIKQIIKMDILSVNTIIEKYFIKAPTIISLDVEGWDLEILRSFDFVKYSPSVFCVETLTYTEDKSEVKIPEISELLKANGYMLFADTYINSIFVKESAWKNRIY